MAYKEMEWGSLEAKGVKHCVETFNKYHKDAQLLSSLILGKEITNLQQLFEDNVTLMAVIV